jgi:hypothetical protein
MQDGYVAMRGTDMRVIKSPELIASQQLAREMSAIDLIAQGLISVPLSERQQRAYDDAVRFAAEVDERERAHYEQLPARVGAENERVLADLKAGRLTSPTTQATLDR